MDTATTWVRWGIGIGILVAVNFASVAYYAGGHSNRIDNNERRINALEQNSVSKESIDRIREDVREIKVDVKGMMKDAHKK